VVVPVESVVGLLVFVVDAGLGQLLVEVVVSGISIEQTRLETLIELVVVGLSSSTSLSYGLATIPAGAVGSVATLDDMDRSHR
jgi:hypothetical protein